ncbi:MAG: phage head-tail connector protein [Clostridium sp.]
MDNSILLEKIKRRSNAASNQSDQLIIDLIEETENEILEYINLDEIPKGLEGTLIELIITKCNRLGSEGIASESFSGVSQSYIDDWSKETKKKLKRFRKLPR